MARTIVKTKIDVDERKALNRVRFMGQRCDDFRPVFEVMATGIAARNFKNYTSNGSLVGGWKPLHPDTYRQKVRNFGTQPTLVANGRLMSKVTKRPFGYENIGKKSMSVGTKLPYAKYHRTGTRYMPKREFMVFDRKMVREYNRLVKRYIAKGVI